MSNEDKKPKKRYSLYRQGVKDAIELMTDTLLNDIYVNDPRVDKRDVEEKVIYLIKKINTLI